MMSNLLSESHYSTFLEQPSFVHDPSDDDLLSLPCSYPFSSVVSCSVLYSSRSRRLLSAFRRHSRSVVAALLLLSFGSS